MKVRFVVLILFFGITFPKTSLCDEEKVARNFIFPPLASLFLPGLDQWAQGEIGPAAAYSGIGLGGIALYATRPEYARNTVSLSGKDDDVRLSHLGQTLYQAAGSYSLFHSFKEITNARDDFSFVHNGEHVDDILLAPFHFQYLTRATTIIPLVFVGALVASGTVFDNDAQFVGLTLGDVAFSSGLSYMAGTGENAIFQGWMMPMFMHWTQSGFWSNFITSGLFAAAHLPRVKFPIIQFIGGFYDGWLVQQSQWTIAETVFIHVWWDVIAFLGNYAYENRIQPVTLRFPPVHIRF